MEDNRENHEKGRERNANHTRCRPRRGTRAPERKVSSTQPPTDERKDGKRKAPGRLNECETQSRRPPCDSGRGNKKGEATLGAVVIQSNNGKTQAHRRVASTGDGKKPLRPHNRISTVEEKPARTEELPWQRTRGRWRSRHSNNTKKADRQQAKENRTQSHPARRRKPQPSSRHTSWAHEDGDRNRKGGQVKNKARKPRS